MRSPWSGSAKTRRDAQHREDSGVARTLVRLDPHRPAELRTERCAGRAAAQGRARPLWPSPQQLLLSRRTHAWLLLALGGQERCACSGAGGGKSGSNFRRAEGAAWCASRQCESELGERDALGTALGWSLQGGRRLPPRPRGRRFFFLGCFVGDFMFASSRLARGGEILAPRRPSAATAFAGLVRRPQLRGGGALPADAELDSMGSWRHTTVEGCWSRHSGRTPRLRAGAALLRSGLSRTGTSHAQVSGGEGRRLGAAQRRRVR